MGCLDIMDFVLVLMFPVALSRGLAECRVVHDRMGPMDMFAQPQSGVCQASLANSSSEIAAVPSWAWHYSQNFTNDGRQFSFCRVFIY